MRAIIIDVEVNSFEAMEPIEVAWGDFKIEGLQDVTSVRYCPTQPLSAGAVAVHGILPGELEGKPPSALAIERIPKADFWIGHNIDFDWETLGKPDVRRICTMALAKSIWHQYESHKLSALIYERFGMSEKTRAIVADSHTASPDVIMCGKIMLELIASANISSIEQLWHASEMARIPERMPFGKHKGELIREVPWGYKKWLLGQDEIDPYLRKALAM